MSHWDAIAIFVLGCFLGTLFTATALQRYCVRSLRKATATYWEAEKLMNPTAQSSEDT